MSTLQSTTQLDDLSRQSPIQIRFDASGASTTSQHINHAAGPESSQQPPPDAAEAIPDGGYGWTIVAACSCILFWINGYATAWGVLQTAIVKSPTLHTNVRSITFVGSLYMACMVGFGIASTRVMRSFGAL
jgi:hypothetical protein